MFKPSKTILNKYAQILVNFALNSGQGVKPGEVVLCLVPDVAKPLALAIQNTLLKAKAHPLIRLLPTEFSKDFYTLANQDQLTFPLLTIGVGNNFLQAPMEAIAAAQELSELGASIGSKWWETRGKTIASGQHMVLGNPEQAQQLLDE